MIFHDFSVIFANFANFAKLKFTLAGQVMEFPGFHSKGWDVHNPHMDRPGFDPSYLNNNSEITWVIKTMVIC